MEREIETMYDFENEPVEEKIKICLREGTIEKLWCEEKEKWIYFPSEKGFELYGSYLGTNLLTLNEQELYQLLTNRKKYKNAKRFKFE